MDDKLKTTARRRALSERNKTAVMLICYPVWTLLILLPIHALLLSLEATFLWMTGTKRGKVQRIYAAILPSLWLHCGDIIALRRKLRTQQAISGSRFICAASKFFRTSCVCCFATVLRKFDKSKRDSQDHKCKAKSTIRTHKPSHKPRVAMRKVARRR